MDSKIRSHVGYSDWTLTTEPSERRAPYDRPDTGAYLIVILLLSLGIWAGIWAVLRLSLRFFWDSLSLAIPFVLSQLKCRFFGQVRDAHSKHRLLAHVWPADCDEIRT